MAARKPGRGRLIDLSQPVHTGMPVYPVLPKTFLTRYANFGDWEGTGRWPSSTDQLLMSTHAGTHIDASAHMQPGVETIDEADLDILWGDAIRVDVTGLEPGGEVDLASVRKVLTERDLQIEPGLIVLFETGMSDYWTDPRYGTTTIGISPEVVAWLLEEGDKVYGLDASSPDVDFFAMPNHQLLGRRPHHQIENLKNLSQLPDRFTFFGFPLALRGATASPIRAVALIED